MREMAWRSMMKARLRRALQATRASGPYAALRGALGELEPWHDVFVPYQRGQVSYLVPRATPGTPAEPGGLPVPPHELWVDYAQTVEAFLQGGREHVAEMRRICAAAQKPLESTERILELGCAAGRMLRWLHDLASTREIWGADVSATHILWCKQALQPPFRFVTTTTLPHLPFEDRHFDFAYAGSVFTHIDDHADSWFLELRRILKPGGTLYATIHDRNTLRLLRESFRDHPLMQQLRHYPEFERYAASDFGMFTIGRAGRSQVFYDREFLLEQLRPTFRLLSANEGSYGYQTALLLERL